MGLEIPPLKIKIMLESNPLKSIMLVVRLGVTGPVRITWSRTNAVDTNGVAAEVMSFDRLWKKVREIVRF